MREHHAFRQARRAARIRQRDEIVRIDRDPRRSTRHRGERVEPQHFSVDLRGHRAGVVEHHHMLDGRARNRLCPDRCKQLRREQEARARIAQLFREIVLRIRAACSRHDGTQPRNRQHGNHVFRGVGREDRTDVALRNPERGETHRGSIDELRQRRVRNAAPRHRTNERRAWAPRRGAGEHELSERRGRDVERRVKAAVHDCSGSFERDALPCAGSRSILNPSRWRHVQSTIQS